MYNYLHCKHSTIIAFIHRKQKVLLGLQRILTVAGEEGLCHSHFEEIVEMKIMSGCWGWGRNYIQIMFKGEPPSFTLSETRQEPQRNIP